MTKSLGGHATDMDTSGVEGYMVFASGKLLVVLCPSSLGLELGSWVLRFSLGLGQQIWVL